jgi:hypothetical protein
VSPESYVAETLDTLKATFRDLSTHFAKPQIREKLKAKLDEKVLNVLDSLYWADPRTVELAALAEDRKLTEADVDPTWVHKLETAKSLLTKSGIGRESTTLVADGLRLLIDQLAQSEPFSFHPSASEQIVQFSHSILRDRVGVTSDQVENCIKPYKYDVDLDDREWEMGRVRAEALMDRERGLMEAKLAEIRNRVGGRRTLDGLVKYVGDVEKEKREIAKRKIERARRGEPEVEESVAPADPYRYNVAHLPEGATRVLFPFVSQPATDVPLPLPFQPAMHCFSKTGSTSSSCASRRCARAAAALGRTRRLSAPRPSSTPSPTSWPTPQRCSSVRPRVTRSVHEVGLTLACSPLDVELLDPFFYQFPSGIDTGLRPALIVRHPSAPLGALSCSSCNS